MKRIFCLISIIIIFSSGSGSSLAEEQRISFGVIPRYNPIIMYRSYQPMMDYLTKTTPYRFELKLSRDYQEAVEFLKNGTTHFASNFLYSELRQ